ncbi:MAG: ABC transporter ATP-binding protein/permease [Lachnospiraceae bacterium]|nr:ABC transporter ATP-binding protein/permease [Lachnospiraceae bacterium]
MISKDKIIRSRQIIATIIYSIIRLTALITPFVMGKIIDDYIPRRNTRMLYCGITIFVVVPFISVLLRTIYNYVTIKFVRKKGNEYSMRIMENLVFKEMTFYDKENSLELLAYASKEIVGYINFLVAELSQFYVEIIVAVATLIMIIMINPVLGAVQLLYIPMAYYPVKIIGKSVQKEIKAVVAKNAENNQIRGDIFQAIEFIKLQRIEKAKLRELEERNNTINGIWGKVAALDTLSGIWTIGFTTVLFTGVTFGIGALLILSNNTLKTGQLVSVITYCAVYYASINFIMQTNISRKKQESEFEKALSFLSLTGEREVNEGKSKFELNDGIYFKNCYFAYPEKDEILSGRDFSFKKGKWTGIVGPSGCGKTTIFDLITKLYTGKDGQIFIDNKDINEIDGFSIRDNITKISQNIFLFPGTIEDNIRLVNPSATREDIDWAIEMACLSDFMKSLPDGIKTDVGEAGKLLSGGERQRLSIVMGLLKKTRILLLDEVSSSLDSETEEKLAKNISELVKEGYTVISISHKREFLKYADEIVEF